MSDDNGKNGGTTEKSEDRRPSWCNPLVLAAVLIVFALFTNAGVLLFNGANRYAIGEARQNLAESKAEADRILDAIRTGNPDRAADNLDFLVKSGLIEDQERRDGISTFLKDRRPGRGPFLPPITGRDPNNRPLTARADLADRWVDSGGQYIFPPESLGYQDGCIKPSHPSTLAPMAKIDRYGQPRGSYLSPLDTSYEARALPYDKAKMPHYVYEVLKPLNVEECRAVAWFDQPGGGIQYKINESVDKLVTEGYLKDVSDD